MIGTGNLNAFFMNYLFYRIYTYYKKKNYIPVAMGIFFLFIFKLVLLFLLGVIINILSEGGLSSPHIERETFIAVFVGILVSVFILDIIRYTKREKPAILSKKFKNNRLNKSIKIWQIFIIPILVVFISIVLIVTVY